MGPHVAVVAFPAPSHAPQLLAVARALAVVAPYATVSFISTAESLARLRVWEDPTGTAVAAGNLRFVEMTSGGGGDYALTPEWRSLFVAAMEAGGLTQALANAAAAAGGKRVTCVVSDAFMWMAVEVGMPWVAVWTSTPAALLTLVHGDSILADIRDRDNASKTDDLLTGHRGLEMYRVRDISYFLPLADSDRDHEVRTTLFRRLAERVSRTAIAVVLNAFPGMFPPDVTAAHADAFPNCLPFGPFHLLPTASATATVAVPQQEEDDRHGCLAWLGRQPARAVVYVAFGTVSALSPDELRELAAGLEAAGAPFLWSLREESWPLLPPGFLDCDDGLVVPWAPQAAVLGHPAVGAFVTHAGWASVLEAVCGGVPMACHPFFADQHMNVRAVQNVWGIGMALFPDEAPVTRARVAEAVAELITGEEGARMRARARDLQAAVNKAFQPDGGSMENFRKFVRITCGQQV